VPHNFFTHFYIVSVASSLFWGWWLSLWQAGGTVRVVWLLMLLQGVRRLSESYAYTSSSKSQMWFVHWIIGLLFYFATGIAVWIELDTSPVSSSEQGVLWWKSAILIPGILTAHALQHTYHAYLYRLRSENKGYQLPSHPLFPNLVCPHYTCEIAIYVLLSFLAAPEGQLVNWTWVCAAIFVAGNLGVTAEGTRSWYVEKFGAAKMSGRKRMIPGVW
jgi:3-oxo-5-alpha-steroid 4-dehydrogenase 3